MWVATSLLVVVTLPWTTSLAEGLVGVYMLAVAVGMSTISCRGRTTRGSDMSWGFVPSDDSPYRILFAAGLDAFKKFY